MQSVKGPGSWGFEGPEVMNPGVRRGTPLKAIEAGTSSVGGAGTSNIVSGAGAFSIGWAGISDIVEAKVTGNSSRVGVGASRKVAGVETPE